MLPAYGREAGWETTGIIYDIASTCSTDSSSYNRGAQTHGAGSDCWQDGSDGEKQVCGNMGAVKVISFKTRLTVGGGGNQ